MPSILYDYFIQLINNYTVTLKLHNGNSDTQQLIRIPVGESSNSEAVHCKFWKYVNTYSSISTKYHSNKCNDYRDMEI